MEDQNRTEFITAPNCYCGRCPTLAWHLALMINSIPCHSSPLSHSLIFLYPTKPGKSHQKIRKKFNLSEMSPRDKYVYKIKIRLNATSSPN